MMKRAYETRNVLQVLKLAGHFMTVRQTLSICGILFGLCSIDTHSFPCESGCVFVVLFFIFVQLLALNVVLT